MNQILISYMHTNCEEYKSLLQVGQHITAFNYTRSEINVLRSFLFQFLFRNVLQIC